jgi:uncharacterized membrane protein
MIGGLLFVLILLTALGCGVMGGVFFVFSVAVMQALARLPAAQGIAAMQSINAAVLNPLFLGVLFGTGALSVVLAVVALMMWPYPGIGWVLAGALLYVVGCIGVTMARNVPRNRALAAVAAESADGAAVWTRYVAEWTAWNHVRAAACVAAAAALIVALR